MDTTVILTLCALAGTIVSAIVGGIGYGWMSFQAAMNKSIALAEAARDKAEKERDTFRDLLRDAVHTLPSAVNNALEREGKPTMPLMAPIVPISHSPVTPEQERQGEIYTALAAIAAAKLALDLPPRFAEKRAAEVTTEVTVQEIAVGEKKPTDKPT